MNHFSVLIQLLRDRKTFLDEVRDEAKLETKIVSLLIASSSFFAVYGAIVGAYGGGFQILSSAIKLPALYLVTLAICIPTLYFFDILSGSKLSFRQYVTMALTAVSVISVLLFAFAPVVLFFLVSIKDYVFFLLLNVLIMTITGGIGVRLFYKGMRDMVGGPKTLENPIIENPVVEKAIVEKRLRRYLLQGWVLLYGLVGSQLGWTLRPFLGVEGEPFQVFRPEIDGNFYAQVLRSVGTMMGWH